MPILEIIIVLALAAVAIRVLPPIIKARAERKRLQVEHRLQLESARRAEDIIAVFSGDRELAEQVYKKLGENLKK